MFRNNRSKLYNQAYYHLLHNDFEETIAFCNKTIERTSSPDELIDAYLYRGSAYQKQGYSSAAVLDLKKVVDYCLEKRVERTYALTNLGLIMLSYEDSYYGTIQSLISKSTYLDQAIEFFSEAILSFPDKSIIFQFPYLYRSLAYAKQGHAELAINDINFLSVTGCLDTNPDKIGFSSVIVEQEENEFRRLALANNFKSRDEDKPDPSIKVKWIDDNADSDPKQKYLKRLNTDKYFLRKYKEVVNLLLINFHWIICKFALDPNCSTLLRETLRGCLLDNFKQSDPTFFFLNMMRNEEIKKLASLQDELILESVKKKLNKPKSDGVKVKRIKSYNAIQKKLDEIILKEIESSIYSEATKNYVINCMIAEQQKAVAMSLSSRIESSNSDTSEPTPPSQKPMTASLAFFPDMLNKKEVNAANGVSVVAEAVLQFDPLKP